MVSGDAIFGQNIQSRRTDTRDRSRSRFILNVRKRNGLPYPTEHVVNESPHLNTDDNASNSIQTTSNHTERHTTFGKGKVSESAQIAPSTDGGFRSSQRGLQALTQRLKPRPARSELNSSVNDRLQTFASWEWDSGLPSAGAAKSGAQQKEAEKPWSFWERTEAESQQEKPSMQIKWPWLKAQTLQGDAEKQIGLPWLNSQAQELNLVKQKMLSWLNVQTRESNAEKPTMWPSLKDPKREGKPEIQITWPWLKAEKQTKTQTNPIAKWFQEKLEIQTHQGNSKKQIGLPWLKAQTQECDQSRKTILPWLKVQNRGSNESIAEKRTMWPSLKDPTQEGKPEIRIMWPWLKPENQTKVQTNPLANWFREKLQAQTHQGNSEKQIGLPWLKAETQECNQSKKTMLPWFKMQTQESNAEKPAMWPAWLKAEKQKEVPTNPLAKWLQERQAKMPWLRTQSESEVPTNPLAKWFQEKLEAQTRQRNSERQARLPWLKAHSQQSSPKVKASFSWLQARTQEDEPEIRTMWPRLKAQTQREVWRNPVAKLFQERHEARTRQWNSSMQPDPPKEEVDQDKSVSMEAAGPGIVRVAKGCHSAARQSFEGARAVVYFGYAQSSRRMQSMFKRWQTEKEIRKIKRLLQHSQDLKKSLEEANEILKQNRKRSREDRQLRTIERKLMKSFVSERCDEIRASVFNKDENLRQRVQLQKELRSANNVLAILQANINSLRQTKDALAVDANYFEAIEKELTILQTLINNRQHEESSFRSLLAERLQRVDDSIAKLSKEQLVEENQSQIQTSLDDMQSVRNQFEEMLSILDRQSAIAEALNQNVGARLRNLQNSTVMHERTEAYEKALGEWRFWQQVGYTKWQFWLLYGFHPRIVVAKQAMIDTSRKIEMQLEGLTVDKEKGMNEEKRKSTTANTRVPLQRKSIPFLSRRTEAGNKDVVSKRTALRYGSGGLVAGVAIGVLLANQAEAAAKTQGSQCGSGSKRSHAKASKKRGKQNIWHSR